jgi:hypothetical protein
VVTGTAVTVLPVGRLLIAARCAGRCPDTLKWLRPGLCLLWFCRVLRNGCGRFQDQSGKEGREGRNEKTAAAMAAVKADRKHVTPQRRQTSRHRDFG